MNLDTLSKFSENTIDVNGNLGWWCHIPKIGRGNSPELQHHSPRSRSSPILSAKAELYSECRVPSAQFTLRPPAEPLSLLGDTLPLYNATHAHERRDKESGGARRAVRVLLRKLIASLPLPCQTTSQENIYSKDNLGSYCNAAISVQVLDPLAPRNCRSVSVQAKTDPCHTNEIVMQTGSVGEAKRKDGWLGGVRALRDSHVRLVLKQLRHIERLNRALDQAAPKH